MTRTKRTQTVALAGVTSAGKETVRLVVVAVILAVTAQSQETPAYSVLYAFTGGLDGSYPEAPLTLDKAGNLCGTATYGGDLTCANGAGCGVVFMLNSSGTEIVLYRFKGGIDGGSPYGNLVLDEAGTLYGTTSFGGGSGLDAGTVFQLNLAGNELVLHGFGERASGTTPYAGLVRDWAGNLYGTTNAGGDLGACDGLGCGVVFMIDHTGTATVLHRFAGPPTDGQSPGKLLRDAVGNLYGATIAGGTSGHGIVFKLDSNSQETVLYNFTGAAEGGEPDAWLVLDDAGNLYGTTIYGGDLKTCWVGPSLGCGVVFKLDASGNETVLYAFSGGKDGAYPYGGLVRDAQGNLYGTTNSGGDLSACSGFNPGCGVVFKLDPAGNETVLYTFSRLADGRSPITGLVAENAGDPLGTSYALYGVTPAGGDLSGCSGDGCGVVFKITLPRASAQVQDPSP